jgi:hypothetical protein
MEISAQTKVNELLQEFPQLEMVLISLNPKFKKLQNPILRNSIGRIATLQQAAAVAELPPLSFVNRLRDEVGQAPLESL